MNEQDYILNKKKHLNAGEVFIVNKPIKVWTVLGSCISVVFYHKKTGKGAICHALLPKTKHNDADCDVACPVKCREQKHDMKYVRDAICYMIDALRSKNIKASELDTFIFGGASLFSSLKMSYSIGAHNVREANDILSKHKVKIVHRDTGGKRGRTIEFDFKTGLFNARTHEGTTEVK